MREAFSYYTIVDQLHVVVDDEGALDLLRKKTLSEIQWQLT